MSKPTKDVLTDPLSDMLFDSDYSSGRFIAQGTLVWLRNTGGPKVIPVSGLGTGVMWPILMFRFYNATSASYSAYIPFYKLSNYGGFPDVAFDSTSLTITLSGTGSMANSVSNIDRYIYWGIIGA